MHSRLRNYIMLFCLDSRWSFSSSRPDHPKMRTKWKRGKPPGSYVRTFFIQDGSIFFTHLNCSFSSPGRGGRLQHPVKKSDCCYHLYLKKKMSKAHKKQHLLYRTWLDGWLVKRGDEASRWKMMTKKRPVWMWGDRILTNSEVERAAIFRAFLTSPASCRWWNDVYPTKNWLPNNNLKTCPGRQTDRASQSIARMSCRHQENRGKSCWGLLAG